MTNPILTIAFSSLCFLSILPAQAEDAKVCRLYRFAQFDMAFDATGRVSVPMTINGQTVSLLIDTGGWMSTLTQSTIDELGLEPQKSLGAYGRMYGGEIIDRYVIVRDALFGGIKAPELGFFVMSNGRVSGDEGGMLAPDIMRQFDVDFDFANSKFNLFSQDHCEGKVVYWTSGAAARVQIDTDRSHHLRVPLQLDGKEIVADLDTGASGSVGSLDDIKDELGLKDDDPNLKLTSDSGKLNHAYRYPFKVLSFEGVAIYNPDIVLRPDSESHTRHVFLLGMNVIRHLHMYVAYKEQALYVTPATAH